MCGLSGMQDTDSRDSLVRFRQAVYRDVLGHRKDSLFELMEAALATSAPATLVRLSLAPPFRRRWPSASDALADGTLEPAAARRLVHATLAEPPGLGRPVWALDGTVWPRPAAATSPERTWGHWTSPGRPQAGIIGAWEYQWLAAIPEASGSWTLPLDVRRRGPTAGSPTALASAQLRAALALRPPGAPRPVVTADSHYDPLALARAQLEADLLVRLAPRRRFYRPPAPYPGRGTRQRKHGAVFKLFAPATHGPPDRIAQAEDPAHGTVTVAVWTALHAQWATDAPLAVVRVQVQRLPKSGKTPQPLWLAWTGGPLPADLLELWRWYRLRFVIEHAFRLLKHDLGWTAIRPRAPEAADRWGWLLALALWQLWLARALVADRRLPWERPLPPDRLTPGRVRRAVAGILAAVGSPARPPRTRGKSPGRPLGHCPGPRPRYPVVYRRRTRPKHAA